MVFVHGAFHRSWVWDAVLERLAPSGLQTRTVDLPSVATGGRPRFGMRDDAEVIREILSQMQQDIVVVAHSYGAIPATQVAHQVPAVRHLVYVAGFQLDMGQSLLSSVGGEIPSWWIVNEHKVIADQTEDVFYNDLDPRVIVWAQSKLLPTSFASFTEPLSATAWRHVPSTYVICERDNAIPLRAQEVMAQRGRWTFRLPSSHTPMLSRPAELAEILENVASPTP